MSDKVVWIPTITTRRIMQEYWNVLYSPSEKHPEIIIANNITIWDNHTFYLRSKLKGEFKQEIAFEHYLWFADFVVKNWKNGIVVIAPDVDWMDLKWASAVEEDWREKCSGYPQLFVPNSWRTDSSSLNIRGYALRPYMDKNQAHPVWTHLLGHKREIDAQFVTYDSVVER